VQVNDDGELVGGLFCAYCGEVNEPEADSCQSCGKYIADQGPDLNARLRRIRRYASSVHMTPDERPQADLIGSNPTQHSGRGALFLVFIACLFRPFGIDEAQPLAEFRRKRKAQIGIALEDESSSNNVFWKEPIRLAMGFVLGFTLGLLLVFLLSR
jgi:hypothetical protein